MLSKRIILISLLIFIVICFTMPAFASEIPLPPPPAGSSTLTLQQAIQKITDIAIYAVGSIAILFLIISGFRFIIAAGNPESVQAARSTVVYVVIGLAIVILAYPTIQFIVKQLSG
jgi:hypothetical protein